VCFYGRESEKMKNGLIGKCEDFKQKEDNEKQT
jgi:hypothetical protein